MKGKIAILISLLIVVSFISGCTTSEVFVNNNEFYGCIQEPVFMDEEVQSWLINQLYEQHLAECSQGNCEARAKIETLVDLTPIGENYWGPGLFGKEVNLPFTYNINRCLPSHRLNNADIGLDTTKCPEESLNVYYGDDTTTSMFSLPFASFMLYVYELIPIPNPNEGCIPTSIKDQYLPPNSKCQLKESYLLVITSEYPHIIVNGNQIEPV